MSRFMVGGAAVTVNDADKLGEGGEAVVYDLHDGRVLKVYRAPNDPMYAGDANAQAEARDRLGLAQKKLAAFPRGVPARMVAPQDVALDGRGKIAGYTMAAIRGGDVMLKLEQPKHRRVAAIKNAAMVPVLRDLHNTVGAVHAAGVVIGDFNDLNVVVRGEEAHLIDADSAQFGAFHCRTFTTRFVDPLVCIAGQGGAPSLARPHTPETDWYAFTAMVVGVFLLVDPYGGVEKPQAGTNASRPMRRVSILHPTVQVPKHAVPYGRLPDELLQHLHLVFEKDQRGVFPAALLDRMRWTTCASCGTEHARAVCPQQGCQTAAPAVKPIVTTVQVRGNVTATSVYRGGGRILRAEAYGGRVFWLAHEGGALKREDGSTVLGGDPLPGMRCRVTPTATYVAVGGKVVRFDRPKGSSAWTAPTTFSPTVIDGAPIFGVTSGHALWCDAGALMRSEESTGLMAGINTRLGDVVAGLTRFWVGEELGFGFARRDGGTFAFVFNPTRKVLRDGVPVTIRGKLLDATCVIAGDRAWFLTQTQEGPRLINRCTLVRGDGTIEAEAETDAGDGSWLGSIRGGAAAGAMLLMPTDDGVVRVEATRGTATATNVAMLAVTKSYPDTAPWVNQGCQVLVGADGLYVLSETRQQITRLVIH